MAPTIPAGFVDPLSFASYTDCATQGGAPVTIWSNWPQRTRRGRLTIGADGRTLPRVLSVVRSFRVVLGVYRLFLVFKHSFGKKQKGYGRAIRDTAHRLAGYASSDAQSRKMIDAPCNPAKGVCGMGWKCRFWHDPGEQAVIQSIVTVGGGPADSTAQANPSLSQNSKPKDLRNDAISRD